MVLFSSIAFGAVLIVLLMKVTRIDPRLTAQQLQGIRWSPFAKVVLLNFALVLVSTEKWRTVDSAIRGCSDSPQARTTSLALTGTGLALGTFLPVQIAMSAVRTFGTQINGSGLKRGMGGTLYEQSFDVVTVGFLGIASVLTRIWGGGALVWTLSAVAAITLALLAVGPTLRLIRYLIAFPAPGLKTHATSLRSAIENLSDLLNSGLLGVNVARRLVALSTARFIVIVLMSAGTAEAIGLQIPLWHMAAAVPFVAIASLLALTPGGVGVNEITAVGVLGSLGTPVAIATQWALANRVLIVISYFIVAICAGGPLLISRMMTAPSSRSEARGH